MDSDKPSHTVTTTEARGADKVNMTRWVLLFGLLLVIPGMLIVWFLI